MSFGVVRNQTFFKADEPSRHERAKVKKADADALWRAVCKAVDARDGRQCRCCDKRSDPEATGLLTRGHRHHIVYRSAGGQDESWNLVTLCAECHADEHANRLQIVCVLSVSGGSTDGPTETTVVGANGPLTFWRKDITGNWFISREEIAVRQVRRD